VVEHVERLDIDLQGNALFDRKHPMDGRIQAPVIWRLNEVAWRVTKCADVGRFKSARVEPLRTRSRRARWRCARRVTRNGPGLEGIARQIGPLVGASVSCVRDVSGRCDIQVLSGMCGEDTVQLPVADGIIGEPVSG